MEAQDRISTVHSDPCLLGGQPRSGTSLLTSVLSSSPEHIQAYELHVRKPSFVVGLAGRYTRNIAVEAGLPKEDYDRILAGIDTGDMNLGAWVGPKEEVSAEQLSGRETDDFTSELTARLKLVQALMRRCAEVNNKRSWGYKILGDIIHAERYAAGFPKTHFILLVRDPRDNALSILQLNSQRAERNQQNFYDDYVAAARGWLATIRSAREIVAQHCLKCLEVRYEDLVTNPQHEVTRLSEFLQIDLVGSLEFYKQEFVTRHAARFKHHENLSKPIQASSVGKWRSAMTPHEVAIFEEHAGDLMEQFGYQSA